MEGVTQRAWVGLPQQGSNYYQRQPCKKYVPTSCDAGRIPAKTAIALKGFGEDMILWVLDSSGKREKEGAGREMNGRGYIRTVRDQGWGFKRGG